MRVLLDNCVDVRFARLIHGHEVVHARQLGWQELSNGRLFAAAEEAGFAVMITVDKNIRHQQNLSTKGICLITLSPLFTALASIAPLAEQVQEVLAANPAPGADILVRPR